MFEDFLNWRQEFKVDELVRNDDYPTDRLLNKAFPRCYHGVSKSGQPILIESPGRGKEPEEVF